MHTSAEPSSHAPSGRCCLTRATAPSSSAATRTYQRRHCPLSSNVSQSPRRHAWRTVHQSPCQRRHGCSSVRPISSASTVVRARWRPPPRRCRRDDHGLQGEHRAEQDEGQRRLAARRRLHQHSEPPHEEKQGGLGEREAQRDLQRKATEGVRGSDAHVVHGSSGLLCYLWQPSARDQRFCERRRRISTRRRLPGCTPSAAARRGA